MWLYHYLCFIRTFPMIPVVAITPSGKVDPENVCLAGSAVDDWYSSLRSTLTEPKTTCDQSVAGTNACHSQGMRKQQSRDPSVVFLWYLMWKQRFGILSMVCRCFLVSRLPNVNGQCAVTFVQTCTLSMVRNKHHSLLSWQICQN